MIILKATQEQYVKLNGYENNNSKINFIKDADDNWVIGKNVLEDPDFAAIKEDLLLLEEIEFKPVVSDI